MANSLHLEIITPDHIVVSRQVEYVSVPGYEGEFGILPHHIAYLSALKVGELVYTIDSKTTAVFISGGFAEVANDKVTILAESAELASDIDVERANQAKTRAQKRLDTKEENLDETRARLALSRAISRIQVAQHTI